MEGIARDGAGCGVRLDYREVICLVGSRNVSPYQGDWTASGSLEAVTSGKVGVHGIQEAASR
jgi:hypothetical protein